MAKVELAGHVRHLSFISEHLLMSSLVFYDL